MFPVLLIVFSLGVNLDITSAVALKGQCMIPVTWQKQAIDVNKLAGTWYYPVGTLGDEGTPPSRCDIEDIVPYIDGSGYTETDVGLVQFHSTWNTYIELYEAKFDEPGTWITYAEDDNGLIVPVHKEWVLYLDDKYQVVYYCSDDSYSGSYYSGIYIGSRATKICDEDWPVLLNAISAAGIANTLSYLVAANDYTNCPKKQLLDMLESLDPEFISP